MTSPLEPRWRGFSQAQVQWIDERCDQYEKEWQALCVLRIEDYLGDTEGPVRTTLWLELALMDQALRQGQGETVTIEEYQDHCPDRAVWLDVATCNMPPFVPPPPTDGSVIDAETNAQAATPRRLPARSPRTTTRPLIPSSRWSIPC